MTIQHTDLSLMCVGHGNRQGNQTRSRFDVAYSDARISAPYVYNRCAAAIVARVHAEIVPLGESCVQGDYPIGTMLVRAALKRPKRHVHRAALRVDRIVIVGPLQNLQLCLPNIRVADIEDGQIGKFVVDDDGEIFLQCAGYTGNCDFLSGTIGVGDALVRLRVQSKLVPGALAAFGSLGSGELAEWNILAPESCNHAAAHVLVEFDA